MKKYPKIKRIGHDENSGILDGGTLCVQEKLDGANFRFFREAHLDPEYRADNRRLVFGSRNVVYKNEKDVADAFEHAVEYVRENANVATLTVAENVHGPLVVFGEAMHPHTLDYEWDYVPSFVGFDIYAVDSGEFLPWYETREILDEMGLPMAPVLHYGDADEFTDEFDPNGWSDTITSEFRAGKPEGLTIKNEETGQRAKLRTQEFKEKHGSQSVSNPDDYEPSDAESLARQFTTEARVLKHIHKFRDRGKTIEMAVMEDLWREVFDDIIEEEYDTIFLGNHTLDTQEFRSEVASITADVLQTYLERPDESVLNEVQA